MQFLGADAHLTAKAEFAAVGETGRSIDIYRRRIHFLLETVGIDQVIENATGITTRIAEDPVNCVAKGIEYALSDIDLLVNNGYLFMSREDISGVTNQKGEDY